MEPQREFDLSSVPAKALGTALLRRVGRRLFGLGALTTRSTAGRFVWNVGAVSNSLLPEADFRNYFDLRNIRTMLSTHVGQVHRACELGCGYGRVTPVLTEFADHVAGLEREPHLLAIAKAQLPDVDLVNVAALEDIAAHGPFDLVMTCTVLQHLPDQTAARVLDAVKRAVPAGWVLLVEKSSETPDEGNVTSEHDFLSRSREVSTYARYLSPFSLVAVADRRLEATYPAVDGKLMLFRRE
jgi:SAM-dependent methyltransferase